MPLLICYNIASVYVAQMVNSLPAMRKTQVWSLGPEDLLEKEMATHLRVVWKSPRIDQEAWKTLWWKDSLMEPAESQVPLAQTRGQRHDAGASS